MTNDSSHIPFARLMRYKPLLIGIMLCAGVLSILWIATNNEREMHNNILIKTKQIAAALDVERIKTLSEISAESHSGEYIRHKEMLASVRDANPDCRFAYIMGQRVDGAIIFYVDSEPIGSANESPAGQVYEDTTQAMMDVFNNKVSITEGPVKDRWGTWVSALTPLTHPKSGELIAVLGMDYDANKWVTEIIKSTAVPAGLIVMVLIMSFVLIILHRRTTLMEINEQKYKHLFEGAAGGIAVVRGDKIILANSALAHVTGHTLENLLREPFVTIIHPQDREMVIDRYTRRMKGYGVETDYDFRVISSDGTVKWVNIVSQLINWDGKSANLSFFTNVTDRKNSEDKLALMYHETTRMNRLMQGREERIIELKKEVNRLSMQLNQGVVYKSVENTGDYNN